VVPLHTHKLLATLQHCAATDEGSAQQNPILARVEVRAGHGAGKPTEKIIEEAADIYAFAAEVIGAEWTGN
jgi:prolyl oligopeptidase